MALVAAEKGFFLNRWQTYDWASVAQPRSTALTCTPTGSAGQISAVLALAAGADGTVVFECGPRSGAPSRKTSGVLVTGGSNATVVLRELPAGTYYCRAIARRTDGTQLLTNVETTATVT